MSVFLASEIAILAREKYYTLLYKYSGMQKRDSYYQSPEHFLECKVKHYYSGFNPPTHMFLYAGDHVILKKRVGSTPDKSRMFLNKECKVLFDFLFDSINHYLFCHRQFSDKRTVLIMVPNIKNSFYSGPDNLVKTYLADPDVRRANSC